MLLKMSISVKLSSSFHGLAICFESSLHTLYPRVSSNRVTLTQAVVEGSVYARNLYEACGFQKIRHVTIQPPKKFEHLAKQRQRFLWMVRPKKSTPAQNVKESA